jgi:uncharacterized protein (TIGR03435 family)
VNGRNQIITMTKQPISVLVANLQIFTERPVLDRTGLPGAYDLNFEATPWFRVNNQPSPDDISAFSAVQQQLGLKLEAAKEPIEVLVIEHFEKAIEN